MAMIDIERTVSDIVDGKKGRGPQKARPVSPWGAFLADGTPYLSPSQVTSLLRCPAMWRFRYLEGRLGKPNPHLIRGSLGHVCLEALARDPAELTDLAKLRKDLMPDLVQVLAHDRMQEFLPPGMDILLEARRLGAAVLQGAGQLARQTGPRMVEEDCHVRTTIQGQEVALRYVPDVYLPGMAMIEDWKFPQRAPTVRHGQAVPRIDHVLSCMLYAWGHRQRGLRVDSVRISHLTAPANRSLDKGAVGMPACTTLRVTDARLAEAKRLFDRAGAIVLSGSLGGNPIGAGWKCDRRYCDHYAVCEDAGDRFGIEVEA
jgi:hypothetical protein